MRGRNEVNIMHTLILQRKEKAFEFRRRKGTPDGDTADFMILAENTAHAAGRKENGARTAGPTDTRFFSVMGRCANDARQGRTLTEPVSFRISSENIAFSRTVITDKWQKDPSPQQTDKELTW